MDNYQIIIKTPDREWLWEKSGPSKDELIFAFKNRFPNWKELWAQLHDRRNLLSNWVKRPGKVRFVAD